MNIQQVQTIIADAMEKHNGIVKKEELTRLGMQWNRTSSFYHCFCDRTYHNDLTK